MFGHFSSSRSRHIYFCSCWSIWHLATLAGGSGDPLQHPALPPLVLSTPVQPPVAGTPSPIQPPAAATPPPAQLPAAATPPSSQLPRAATLPSAYGCHAAICLQLPCCHLLNRLRLLHCFQAQPHLCLSQRSACRKDLLCPRQRSVVHGDLLDLT